MNTQEKLWSELFRLNEKIEHNEMNNLQNYLASGQQLEDKKRRNALMKSLMRAEYVDQNSKR